MASRSCAASSPTTIEQFIAPVALLMVSRAGDDGNQEIENGRMTGVYRNNYLGRAVGGGLGFGLLGSALGRLSRPFGVGLGLYGAGRSIYFNVIARGQEVTFPIDTPLEVRLGSSAETPE